MNTLLIRSRTLGCRPTVWYYRDKIHNNWCVLCLQRAARQDDSTVPARDLSPFLGRRCQMMVQCTACGGTHVHEGTLAATGRPGELLVDGRSFPLTAIRALVTVSTPDAEPEPTISRGLYNLAWLSGIALAALTALRLAGF